MATLRSKDGTAIAFDEIGKGPAVILVNGALGHRALNGEKQLASLLAKHFTVLFYDRRGRGETVETVPYSVQGEIEDIEALIDHVGGNASLYGVSSGAALALLAAHQLGAQKAIRLALYEPPFDAYLRKGHNTFSEVKTSVQKLVNEGKPGDAIAFFFESLDTPSDVVHQMKQAPNWKAMEQIGHTLVYDFEVLGDGGIPLFLAKGLTIPVLLLNGGKSYGFIQAALETLFKTIPGAQHQVLKDQTHQVADDALFPLLTDFFGNH